MEHSPIYTNCIQNRKERYSQARILNSSFFFYSSHLSGFQRDSDRPESGLLKVNKGGSYLSSKNYIRSSFRGANSPVTRSNDIGFRCAETVKKKKYMGVFSLLDYYLKPIQKSQRMRYLLYKCNILLFFIFVLSSCANLLDKNFSKITPIQIENKIKNGIDLNLQDKDGNTVLHLAARNSTNPTVIEVLLQADADIYARNKNSWTPLHEATRYNPNPKIIASLLKTKIDINIHTQNRYTPLHLAARGNKNAAIITVLVEAKAEVNARSNNAWTALHLAADNSSYDVISALLKAGADVHSKDRFGLTALHWAAGYNKDVSVIVALISAGADINTKDLAGFTPLDYAKKHNKNPKVIHTLIQAKKSIEL